MNLAVRSALSLAAVLLVCSSSSFAAFTFAAPEIDPSMATAGLVLLGGAITVLRGRTKR